MIRQKKLDTNTPYPDPLRPLTTIRFHGTKDHEVRSFKVYLEASYHKQKLKKRLDSPALKLTSEYYDLYFS